ncbi:MAG: DNA-binding response regulator [Salinivirgaceae bacterium]|nr:MAG: DNA-binding response regulator [Salinivirgaceae bacterium]
MTNSATYKCLVIDDEPMAIAVIKEHLEQFENIECTGEYTRAIDAIAHLNKEEVDLIFLDINMPNISGIEFLKSLVHPPEVIFTTAYRNFAVDAFELNALDYLMKPISLPRFLKAVNKFLEIKKSYSSNESESIESKSYIILKSDKKNYKIQFDDILYIESLDNYIRVYTSEKSLIVYQQLSVIETELPSEKFLRIHRSTIINKEKITVFTSSQVEIGDKQFTIGRSYREEVAQKLR